MAELNITPFLSKDMVEVVVLRDKEEAIEAADGEEKLVEVSHDRRDSRVRIAPGNPVVISAEGGNEWTVEQRADPEHELQLDSYDMPSSSSSDNDYELEEELRRTDDDEEIDMSDSRAVRRLTNENTRRNSIQLAPRVDSEDLDGIPSSEPSYSEYDKSGSSSNQPPYHVLDVNQDSKSSTEHSYHIVNAAGSSETKTVPPYQVVEALSVVQPYQVVDLPIGADLSKKRAPPRPTRPPSELSPRRAHLPPVPSSPPPPTPNSNRPPVPAQLPPQRNGTIPEPPNTPPPPTPRSKTTAPPPIPPPPVVQETPGQLPKILYEEKDTNRHPDLVPIMYATPSTSPPKDNISTSAILHSNDPKRSSSFLNKMGKGMKQLKKRLTSPESPDAPQTGSRMTTSSQQQSPRASRRQGPHQARERRQINPIVDEKEMEDRRRGRIQTQKNVKPPKPPPPSRTNEIAVVPVPKPRLLGGFKDKIVDLEDISCLDSLFPFLFSISRLHSNESAADTLSPMLLDSCARAFLGAWTRKWRRRAEKDEARGTPGGTFHLGECSLFEQRHHVFEAHLLDEKLVALPPSQVSVAAYELLPPSMSSKWRSPVSTGLTVVAVRCCIPVERLLSQLGSIEEPMSRLRRHLALVVLVLLLSCNLPSSVDPSQVMVLLARHDIRFLIANDQTSETFNGPQPHASLLKRLVPHLIPEAGGESDLEIALQALRLSLLPGIISEEEWRRQMAPQLLPRLFETFSENDFFAPFLMSLLLNSKEGEKS